MQRVAGWKFGALVLGVFGAIWLVREVAVSFVPSAATSAVAQEAAEEGATGDAAGGTTEAPPRRMSYLEFFFRALGIRYSLAFLVLSFTFVAYLVMNLLSLRRDGICPRHLAAAFDANLNEKKFQEAFDLAKNDDSMLGQMLAAGMQNLQQGYDKALDSMGQVGEEENMKLEHRLSFLSLVGSIAPMVGLLGTVDGMVATFQEIAIAGAQPKASDLAEGISMALITTLVGLILAIPAIIAFNIMKNRLTRLVMEAGQQAGNLMSRFETMGKQK
ncbi:MAG TPA: MotA/TolQ/ExbB proton channel family protein [Pirellulaceae bacterium]|nr:MotA/TolQ/ExbB proton channel family protein [Pirellulaceae bacterium]